MVASLGAGYNEGNYRGAQLSDRLPQLYQRVADSYHGRVVRTTAIVGGKTYPVDATIPSDAPVVISSGYRNPQRNELVSKAKNSPHLWGRALDLVPCSDLLKDPKTHRASCGTPVKVWVVVEIRGKNVRTQVTLNYRRTLYPALLDAAASSNTSAMCEVGSKKVDCGNWKADHVHVNWRT